MSSPSITSERTYTLLYLMLVGLTLLTWVIGEAGLGGLGISLPVLGAALLKGLLIGDWFMGLRGLRSWWRWVIIAWLLIPGILISTAFVLSVEN